MKLNLLRNYLVQPINGSSLAVFRILLGGIMAFFVWHHCPAEVIDRKFVNTNFHFTYPLFDFLSLPIFSRELMHLNFTYMGLAALGICFGFLYRVSLIVFIATFGYMFLLEKTIYNNHYYLIILVMFLLLFMKGDHWYAVDNVLWPKKDRVRRPVPFWNIFSLRAQICILYFFGGIAKCNTDWLQGYALRVPLLQKVNYPFIGPYVQEPWLLKFFAYGGLIFDLSAGFLFCFRKTRMLAFVLAFFFHSTNKWIWNIGIFHYFMLGTFILFINPATFARFTGKVESFFGWKHTENDLQKEEGAPKRGNTVLVCMAIYLLIQVMVPLRHWFYPGDVAWNAMGDRFSWRIYARSVQGSFDAIIVDPKTGQREYVYPLRDITKAQANVMGGHPDMVLQYIYFLKKKYQSLGIENPEIYVTMKTSINGHPAAPFSDPTVDLTKEKLGPFGKTPDWILPREGTEG